MGDLIPIVFERGGVAVATSQDVAAYFGKRHDDVLKRIRGLRKNADTPAEWFTETVAVNPQNGEAYPVFDMTRDGFTLLAVGFTGERAHRFKVGYIQAFSRMERSARQNGFRGAPKEKFLAALRRMSSRHSSLTPRRKVPGRRGFITSTSPKRRIAPLAF